MQSSGIATFVAMIRRPRVAAALLLAAFAVTALLSSAGDSATFDETTHLPAGISYLQKLDFRHNPEHPPLAKAWAGLLPVLLGRAHPDYASAAWAGARVPPHDPKRSRANQWRFGFETINGPLDDRTRRDPARLLFPARAMIVLLGVGLGLVVYSWSRSLWGDAGAMLSTFLFACSPTMLAHTRLVTTDLAAALGFAASAWMAWRWTRRRSWRRAALLGLVIGAALLVKFSALLVPVLLGPAILLAVFRREREDGTPRQSGRPLLMAGLCAMIAWMSVWAGYGARWSAVADPGYRLEWESMEAQAAESSGVRLALGLRDARIVPEAYAFGLAYLAGGAGRRLGYLNGETSIVGWWWYFPEAFLLKTPVTTLVLIAVVVVVTLSSGSRIRRRAVELAFLGIPVVGYFVVSTSSHLNLGHRHLAPIYPFLFVGLGALARLVTTRRRRAALAVACTVLAAGTLASAPGFLSYFNVLGGGSSGGARYLVDSNVDWGQDLARLPATLREHGVDRVHLAYFGTADPRAYDLRYRKVLMVHDFRPEEPLFDPRSGDVVAISLTLLHGMYLEPDREFATAGVRAGVVRREDVETWLRHRDEQSLAGRTVPGLAEWLEHDGRIDAAARRDVERGLRSSRIVAIRERLKPFARAGASILLYRIPEGFDVVRDAGRAGE